MDSSSIDQTQFQSLLEGEKKKAMVNEVIAKTTYVCWDKCIGSIGSSFSRSEVTCLTNCARSFLELKRLIAQHVTNPR